MLDHSIVESVRSIRITVITHLSGPRSLTTKCAERNTDLLTELNIIMLLLTAVSFSIPKLFILDIFHADTTTSMRIASSFLYVIIEGVWKRSVD